VNCVNGSDLQPKPIVLVDDHYRRLKILRGLIAIALMADIQGGLAA
jgi:hypothetical protein